MIESLDADSGTARSIPVLDVRLFDGRPAAVFGFLDAQ